MEKMRRASGLIAAVIVFLMGLGFMAVSPSPLVSAGLLALGAFGIVWQGRKLYAERRDPYDLSRLWERDEEPNDEPEEPENDDTNGEVDTMFCHHCGHAVPRPFVRCPDCGNPLR